jgi:hypothetical protein
MPTNVSEELYAYIFRTENDISFFVSFFDPENGGGMFLRNID